MSYCRSIPRSQTLEIAHLLIILELERPHRKVDITEHGQRGISDEYHKEPMCVLGDTAIKEETMMIAIGVTGTTKATVVCTHWRDELHKMN